MSTQPHHALESQLRDVVDPALDDDVMSLQLVDRVEIDEETGTATVKLKFNAPFAPQETAMGEEIRDIVRDSGYDPNLEVLPPSGQPALPEVRNVIAVASGKGGVGKTTVAVNLADGLRQLGARTGLIDGDIHGPNVPEMLDLDEPPRVTDDYGFVPGDANGLQVMSLGHIIPRKDDPAAFRGPMIEKFMRELFEVVEWGPLDYLIVDLPPGTGDATFSLLQNVAVTGSIIVTTGHEMSVVDAQKGLQMFRTHGTPVLGIVENMSSYACPNCDETHKLFGSEESEKAAEKHGVPLLATVPFDPEMSIDGTVQTLPVRSSETAPGREFRRLAPTVANLVGEVNRRLVAEGRSLQPSPVEGSCS